MESKQRGRSPRVVVGAVIGVAFVWACGGDGMNVITDAAFRDVGRCSAQDGGDACEPQHGSVDIQCARTTWMDGDGIERSLDYALVDAPPNAVVEICVAGDQCPGCTGSPPPDSCTIRQFTGRVGEQMMITQCVRDIEPALVSQRAIW